MTPCQPQPDDHHDDLFTLDAGNIVVQVHDESCIHIRAITKFGDPVELSEEEAKELGELLLRLADRIH